jgi:hypothetical protein
MDIKHCGDCDKDIKTSNWAKHTKSNKHQRNAGLMEEKKYVCSEADCDYEGPSRSALYSHKKRVHGDGADAVTYYQYCEVCELPLQSASAAKAHRASKKHHDKVVDTRPDLCHKSIAGRVIPQLAQKVVVEKVSVHRRIKRYQVGGGKELEYTQYMSEDFYLDFDESEYDIIINSLVAFVNKKTLNLETEMEFQSNVDEHSEGKLDDDAKIVFIRRMANAIHSLLNPEDALEPGDLEDQDEDEEDEEDEEEEEEDEEPGGD